MFYINQFVNEILDVSLGEFQQLLTIQYNQYLEYLPKSKINCGFFRIIL
jgi:hypothetical protein